MSQTDLYLPGASARARWMRLETAEILKRFYFCERALLVGMAAWIPSIRSLEIKMELPHLLWQNAQTADALRKRVFELRYPNRLMEAERDSALITLCKAVQDAPSAPALLWGLGKVMLPALRDAYRAYLELSDPIADGPTYRFLTLALAEKEQQTRALCEWAEAELASNPALQESALLWTQALASHLNALGGIGLDPPCAPTETPNLPCSQPYAIPDSPARDPRFRQCRFYWPDIVDPTFPYGEGVGLQLRTAISHINEVWAVETGGIILSAFADLLPWEWIVDASRWTYDEARHCRMGYDRLLAWGFDPAALPLGTYIYDSAAGQDPIYRLGMLFFFETKNIKHKPKRADLLRAYGDTVSEHDMDFDWADETIHAGYGKHWLMQILEIRGQEAAAYADIREQCRLLVEACLSTVTSEEKRAIKQVAQNLMAWVHSSYGSSNGTGHAPQNRCVDEGDPV